MFRSIGDVLLPVPQNVVCFVIQGQKLRLDNKTQNTTDTMKRLEAV